MAGKKIIRVGVDLDGVVAQHALGGFWVWLRELKEKVLKKASVSNYYYPSTALERVGWRLIDWLRKPFVDKEGFFAATVQKKNIQFYLVTSRFKFLGALTQKWLQKYDLNRHFHQTLINVDDLDPSEFKVKAIRDLKLDFFIDDDLDLINCLKEKTKAKFFWVVPGHQKKSDNHDPQIETCKNFLEALEKILKP